VLFNFNVIIDTLAILCFFVAQRKAFNEKRKHHYNEFLMIQKARQLIAQDEDDENEAQMDIQDVQEHQNMGSQRVVDSELGE
jgi:hypothetical protein